MTVVFWPLVAARPGGASRMLSTYGDTDIPYFTTCTVARCSKISHFLLLILNKASKKIYPFYN